MKTKIKSIVLCIILIITVSSCDNDSEKERITKVTVASETTMLPIVPSRQESEHMIITDESKQILYLPIGCIENFQYEKGFEYKLLIKITTIKNPPMDSGSDIYSLIELLSKNKKDI